MRRMWAAGAAVMVFALLVGLPAVAQSPAAVQSAWATGTQTCSTVDEGTSTTVDGVTQVRDQMESCVHTMSDPRVSGKVSGRLNVDNRGAAGTTFWGTEEIIGPEGTWRGSFSGVVDPHGLVAGVGVFEGTGAYSGWTYINSAQGQFSGPTLFGSVYHGPPPPWGPLPSPASE